MFQEAHSNSITAVGTGLVSTAGILIVASLTIILYIWWLGCCICLWLWGYGRDPDSGGVSSYIFYGIVM